MARKSALTKSQLNSLQRLTSRRVPAAQAISPELASELAELALELNTPVSCLVDRRGKVRHWYLGELSRIEGIQAQVSRERATSLAQLRLIYATPSADVSRGDLLLLRRYHLDALIFVHASRDSEFSKLRGDYLEGADHARLCHLSRDGEISVGAPQTLRHLASEVDFRELVQDIEEEIASSKASVTVKTRETAVIVGRRGREDSLDELRGLVHTAGAEILDTVVQSGRVDNHYFLGKGKLEQLRLLVEERGADLVVFDDELSPAQSRNIENLLGKQAKLLDRSELILDIFAQRARSEEGKLQVELAQLKYLAPKLIGGYQALSKLGGGIGTRGPGETKLEVERRRLQKRIDVLEKRVQQVSRNRALQRRRRQKARVPVVSLVGYTNAGKSTLFNALTKEQVLVEDKLFATLDPTVREGQVPEAGKVLFSDTVGFIQNLPTTLIKAFRATLEEVSESDLMIKVVDACDPYRLEQLQVVEDIFRQLSVDEHPQMLVFNKVDQLSESEIGMLAEQYPEAVFVSASHRQGLDRLRGAIGAKLNSVSTPAYASGS